MNQRTSNLPEILEEVDFESWLEHEGVDFKITRGKSGPQAMIRECPACGNEKWKVYINLETGIGNCFRCDEKFTKWKFASKLLQIEGADLARYFEDYARQNGWKPRKTAAAPVQQPTLVLPESVPLPHEGRNLRYLANRNITAELAAYFGLRWCKRGHFDYLHVDGTPRRQDYSERIIIPVHDADGVFVSFQGRDTTGLREPKYLFPPGFATTGSVLYNAQNAFGATRAVIGEGVFDCIAIKAAMDEDRTQREFVALASFGKKLSVEQARVLNRLKIQSALKDVVIMWDGEGPALASAVEAAKLLHSMGLSCSIALLPKDRDPNEVAPQVVRDAIWNAVPYTMANAIKLMVRAGLMQAA